MGILVSPGVEVTVIDESQYASNDARDTIPLIILATHQDKTIPDGTAVAGFTTKAEAGEVKLITSPRELVQQYGNPIYYDSNGTILQGNELNESGLLSAYKALNVTNRVYVLRADVDLNELNPDSTAPVSDPEDGTYWFDISTTEYGIFVYESAVWVNKPPSLLNRDVDVTTGVPNPNIGKDGEYAVVTKNDADTDGVITYYQKLNSVWVVLGSSAWDLSTPSIARSTIPFSSASNATLTGLPQSGDTVILDVDSAGAETVTLESIINGTSNLQTSNTLGLKTLNLNGSAITLGVSSGGSVANSTFTNTTNAISGLNVGEIFRITDTAGSDDITMTVEEIGSGFNATGLAGNFTINGITVDLTGVTSAADLDAAIDAAFATDQQGFTVTNDGSEVTLLKDSAISGENNPSKIVIDISGVAGGDTGFATGTTNMSTDQVANSVTLQVSNTDNVTATALTTVLTIADSVTGFQLSNISGTPVTTLGLALASSVTMADIEIDIEAATTNIEVDDTAGNDVPIAGNRLRMIFTGVGDFTIAAGTANTELGFVEDAYRVSLNSIVTQINDTITFLNTDAAAIVEGGANFITITNTDSLPMTLSGTGSAKLGFPATTATSSIFFASHTNVPSTPEEGDIWIKTTTPNFGANYIVNLWTAASGQFSEIDAPLFETNVAAFDGFGASLVDGSLFVSFDALAVTEANFRIKRYNGASTLVLSESNFVGAGGSTIFVGNGRVAAQAVAVDDEGTFVSAVNNLGMANISAAQTTSGITITNSIGEDIVLVNGTANVATILPSLTAGTFSNWVALRTVGYQAQETAPVGPPVESTLWFDASVSNSNIDLLVNDDALNQWITYVGDLQISATRPSRQGDGIGTLADGDLWIDSGQLDDYPLMYRWEIATGGKWVLINNSDQTSTKGILFADAREDSTSNLDPDCPNPLLFPAGMLLWNTRASSMVVKEYRGDWFGDDTTTGENFEDTNFTLNSYDVGNDTFPPVDETARWVTISGNEIDGTAYMGRKAQRKVIVNALASAVSSNEDLRDVRRNFFNLMLTPGYPELIDEMVTLNIDRKETAFIISDVPKRIANSSQDIQDWVTNADNAPSTGEDGLTTRYTYSADYYPPLGLTTNLDGNEVATPSSLGALYAYLYNDNIAFPWFAPAGINRGLLSGVFSSVGYLDDEEEYKPVQISRGLQDVLYTNNLNPIVFSPQRGLYVNGQKTLSPSVSALDRVNVARLVVYLRYQLELLGEEFLFEINDETTRNSVQNTFDRFLGDLLGLRAIFDYLVVVDDSNNTPARIDANELWIDIAIKPAKAIEFIYIPIRVKNTGDDLTA